MFTRPHDLLRLTGPVTLPDDAPAWAATALRSTPWVVVRRGPESAESIAVGVRGRTRSERYGTHLHAMDVREVVAPEALAHGATIGRDMPAMDALRAVRYLLDGTGLAWGPTGSVAFELATGQPTVTADSDLDVLLRVGGVADALPALTALHRELGELGTRVDCQVETRWGAVALAELVGPSPDVMLRTAGGPRLVARIAVP